MIQGILREIPMPSRPDIAKALGIPPDEQAILDAGSRHFYTCRCQQCKLWWQLMGPEDGSEDGYGPFKPEEIEDETEAGQAAKAMRERLKALEERNY